VTVVGCGEAFDDRLPNTSLLIRTASATMLLDCGFSAAPEVWKHAPDPNAIDLVYISHAHADHYFGLPALFGRMWEEGRTKPLTVLTQPYAWQAIEQVLTLGYRSLRSRYKFNLNFLEARGECTFADATFRFAQTKHSASNFAVRIDSGGKTVCYSGDGGTTPESRALFDGADLLVHEAFGLEPSEVHASVDEVLDAAPEGLQRLALVHVSRYVRRERAKLMHALLTSRVRCLVPAPGDVIPMG
jgi:ribonuclease BN (tRNA processing enzyme)